MLKDIDTIEAGTIFFNENENVESRPEISAICIEKNTKVSITLQKI